jgi:hypothetical protein
MTLEQTPFCTAQGLLNFSKALTELYQKLLTVHNLNIKDKAQEDKLEFSGTSEGFFVFGRHFIVDDQYDFWIGLHMTSAQVTVTIEFVKIKKRCRAAHQEKKHFGSVKICPK